MELLYSKETNWPLDKIGNVQSVTRLKKHYREDYQLITTIRPARYEGFFVIDAMVEL